MIFTILDYIGTGIAIWVLIFLLHELMHIRSQGLTMTGKIWVKEWGMVVSADHVYNRRLFGMGGGILSSIVCFLLYFLSQDVQWQWGFFTMGWIQFAYGLYEGWVGVKHRYVIYGVVGIICTIYWLVMA